jgi:ABC-type lipoprotein export system ATPase subunit
MNEPRTESLVQVREVSHTRGAGAAATLVLHDVDLSLAPAALVVLAGRSGSGKSTLCHLVAGVMAPSTGQVLVAGRPAYPVTDWAEVSLLPQRLSLEPELTVAENVFLPAGVRGGRVRPEVLDRLGLTAIADRPARDTSLGEQQRTALARALVLDPAVAVLDEPTAHQDDEHVHLVLDMLAVAVRAGTLALVATHDPRVIDAADVVVRLHSGRVVPSG